MSLARVISIGPRCVGLRLAFALALAVATIRPAAAQEVGASASLDRVGLAVGETTLLDIKVSGSQNALAPPLGDLAGFDAHYIGPATQMSYSNGQMSAWVSHRYQLTARAAGRFTIGPFDVQVDGTTYRTQPIVVNVTERAARPKGEGDNLRIELRVGRPTVYVGERVPVTLKLLIGQGMRVEDLQYPVFSAEGAVIEKLGEPAQRDEVVNGQRYRTLYFENRMVPLRAGSLDLGASMALNVIVPQAGRRQGFGGIFGDVFGERRAMELHADPVMLAIQPLPTEGRPAGFTGAVGSFTFEMSAAPSEVQEGDPITLRMRVAGDGDLSKIATPRVAARDDLRVYDPLGVKVDGDGERVFEQVVIPLRAGPTDLPALRFSYFDPVQGKYETIERGPIPVVVRASSVARLPEVLSSDAAAAAAPREAKALGRDIVFIKEAPGSWRASAAGFGDGPWFWLAQMLPLGLLIAVSLAVRRREHLAANPRLRRFQAAGEEAKRGLAGLEADVMASDFFDRLVQVVSAYLVAKLDLPPGAVEGSRVTARLAEIGGGAQVGDEVTGFFDLLQGVRYASAESGAARRGEALAQAKRIIGALEGERRIDGWMTRALTSALMAMLATAPLSSLALAENNAAATGGGPAAAFFAGNASYAAGDYPAALRSYEEILASGVESGAVLFNLGNAYFKSGDAARAIANYMRAERLLPRDPDVAANLAYAREVAEIDVSPEPFWWRALLLPAYRFAGTELGLAATVVWWLACILWALRLLRPAQATGLGRAGWICGAVALYLFGSLIYRNARLELRDIAVVTAGADVVVRFEPSESGTQHFAAIPGTSLTVTDQHPGWLQVIAGDGRRGWIPAAAVTELR